MESLSSSSAAHNTHSFSFRLIPLHAWSFPPWLSHGAVSWRFHDPGFSLKLDSPSQIHAVSCQGLFEGPLTCHGLPGFSCSLKQNRDSRTSQLFMASNVVPHVVTLLSSDQMGADWKFKSSQMVLLLGGVCPQGMVPVVSAQNKRFFSPGGVSLARAAASQAQPENSPGLKCPLPNKWVSYPQVRLHSVSQNEGRMGPDPCLGLFPFLHSSCTSPQGIILNRQIFPFQLTQSKLIPQRHTQGPSPRWR